VVGIFVRAEHLEQVNSSPARLRGARSSAPHAQANDTKYPSGGSSDIAIGAAAATGATAIVGAIGPGRRNC
jgi:hypothetical protein